MYRQINIHTQDRVLQSFLRRYSSYEHIQEYNLTNVKCGTPSALYLASLCLKNLADAAQILGNDFYVDDSMSGTSTTEDAIKV